MASRYIEDKRDWWQDVARLHREKADYWRAVNDSIYQAAEEAAQHAEEMAARYETELRRATW